MARHKIINDPVHGFIPVPGASRLALIDSPELQRLRQISQLGLTSAVYPGATHSRFQHALGAMHLMGTALDTLRSKGVPITDQEQEAALEAILLHDIGHSPLSHALEGMLLPYGHEVLTLALMEGMNRRLNGALDLAISIFRGEYPARYLHQLVTGQLDVDRLDYLLRDSFYTGVIEGKVPADRLLAMLTVHRGELAIEQKGLYSVESFLMARRIMYWQVYLHKTVIAVQLLLEAMMGRAQFLAAQGQTPNATPALRFCLEHTARGGAPEPDLLQHFLDLDDSDLLLAIKHWQEDPDPALSFYARSIYRRRLPRLIFTRDPVPESLLEEIRGEWSKAHPEAPPDTAMRLIRTGEINLQAYDMGQEIILVDPSQRATPLSRATPIVKNLSLLDTERKFYVLAPKSLWERLPGTILT